MLDELILLILLFWVSNNAVEADINKKNEIQKEEAMTSLAADFIPEYFNIFFNLTLKFLQKCDIKL